MRKTRGLAAVLAAAPLLLAPASAELPPNPWMARQPLNIAHQGGAKEAPSNTLYAFKTALLHGADVLEMDVHATADRHLVVIHDSTVDRTTNGNGRIDAMTLAQIKALDAAYWWSPGTVTCRPPQTCDYVFRGVAMGEKAPPPGYTANDFTIPTLREVLETFPGAWMNVEIKATAPETFPYEKDLADLLAQFGRTTDTIVVSFNDGATEVFKVFAPSVSTATGTLETAVFWASARSVSPGAPNPRYHALQVPIFFSGVRVVDEEFVANANANALAVHVWTIDDPAEMRDLLSIGVEGIMTDVPTVLEAVLTGG